MRTQVGIVGAGPAGLMLAHLLHLQGVESVVLESRSRDYVEQRIRAGLLEQGTVDLLRGSGVGDRLERESIRYRGVYLRTPGWTHHVDMQRLVGRSIWTYAQQELVKDLIAARLSYDGPLHFEAADAAVHDLDRPRPRITYMLDGERRELECEAIAGCDGFHGVCRPSIPDQELTIYEHEYPFEWLGILAEAPPATDEPIYCWHPRGFALYAIRGVELCRLFLQVPAGERLEDWPDERIWEELQLRMAAPGWRANEGPIVQRGITAMRSFVCEPMQFGRLYLAGDSAHIVPPTGAKGLNLALNDARLLAAGLTAFLRSGSSELLDSYSRNAVRRVWRVQDFSRYMTGLLHQLGGGEFERRLQLARLEQLARSEAAARDLADNYTGLPRTATF